MKKNRRIYATLVFLFLAVTGFTSYAQTRVTGKVTDETNQPLPGVVVMQTNTQNKTSTDGNGVYVLTLQPNSAQTLTFTYIGYNATTLSPAGGSLNISLKPASQSLSDVVVVGYTSQKKASITGSVATVDMNDLQKTRIVDVAQALQGQVAGVFVAANTGAPGDGIKLRIRGEGTLGNNDVLYVIDGVPTRDISFLNQSDVKSMTVLKDAAAGAIYGSRAANGVVVITTFSGTKGKANINVEYFAGFHQATNLPKMLNADQYLTIKDRAWHNTLGNAANAVSPYQAARSRTDLADTDWLGELFETGKSKNLQASVNGGSDQVQYLISTGYYKQDGIVVQDHDGYERFNFRSNVNANITDRFKVGTNLQLSFAKQDKLSSSGDVPGVIRHALLRPPVLGVYKSVTDPTYSAANPYTDLPFYTSNNNGWDKNFEFSSNPIAIVNFTNDKRKTFQTFGNLYAEYAFLSDKSLTFRSSVGVDISFSHNKNFAQNYGDDNDNNPDELYPGKGRNNKPNNLDENRGEVMNFTFTNTLNYVKTFAQKHNVNFLLGAENISSKSSAIGGSRQNFNKSTSGFQYLDYGSLTNIYNSGSASEFNLVSFFGSGTYNFDNKYFATATLRADGSSRFGPSNKWGYFPSASAGWIISNEEFMKDAQWISELKLRGSWGQAGNQEIPNNTYQTLVSESGGIVNVVRYGNPDVKWETTTQTNFGIDFGVLKNRLSLTADYFVKKTDDILLTVGLPAVSVGVIDRTYVNAGEVTNKGFEFGLNFRNQEHAFKYNVNANIATLTNRVNKLQEFVKNINDDRTHTRTEVGQPINSYFGLVFDGIYQTPAEVSSHLFTNANGALPGDIKFKDLNGDGQINADDRTTIGNPVPKLTYGFAFSSSFKKFDFSFLLQGVQGVDRYNDLKQIINFDSRPFNSMTSVLDSWNGPGTSNTLPRVTFNNNGGGNVSSVFVEDASYLRLKNIEVGYTFDVKKIGVKNVRLYASGQNLFTVTDYTGLDPESTSLIDQGTYPQSKAFILGLKINL
ncbi:SusC/RagA family TonB-linked outer membrane protein [Pedobacter agri]|uniref:TonB-dependent receptor n=1 Tax=Pedobacter agri TaxID=454586 RepID=A0A9X3I8V2_9SPHI|nr:TonB-dependent receptor [Pedobacter agri]MCX3263863.1 TonB-dependent receptor [Pedobacter agri]